MVASAFVHPQRNINREWTAALCAIESDEPSLTAAVTVELKIALVDNTESSIIFGFCELTVLQEH